MVEWFILDVAESEQLNSKRLMNPLGILRLPGSIALTLSPMLIRGYGTLLKVIAVMLAPWGGMQQSNGSLPASITWSKGYILVVVAGSCWSPAQDIISLIHLTWIIRHASIIVEIGHPRLSVSQYATAWS